MPIVGKPVSSITTEDVMELLHRGAVENITLEFKSEPPEADEAVKKLSSFANTFGGHMVVGARGDKGGKLIELPGVEVQAGYKQTIVQWCARYATPPVQVEVSEPIPLKNGKYAYVVSVMESGRAPHFLSDRKGLYVRTNEHSTLFGPRLADESEIRHLLDRRRLMVEQREALVRRAQERADFFLRKCAAASGGKTPARLALCIVPKYAAAALRPEAELRALIENRHVDWRQSQFPRSTNFMSQHGSILSMDNRYIGASVLEVGNWGVVRWETDLRSEQRGMVVCQGAVVGYCLLFLRYARLVLGDLGASGSLLLRVRLDSVRGVQWALVNHNGDSRTTGSPIDNTIDFDIDTHWEELSTDPVAIAKRVIRMAMFAVNLDRTADEEAKLDQLISSGRDYNGWSKTDGI